MNVRRDLYLVLTLFFAFSAMLIFIVSALLLIMLLQPRSDHTIIFNGGSIVASFGVGLVFSVLARLCYKGYKRHLAL